MSPARTPTELKALARDPDFLRLDAIAVPFDPLSVLAWSRREAPHTRFLAWLLDPSPSELGADHGLGALVLDALVQRALGAVEALPGVDLGLPAQRAEIDARSVKIIREAPVGDGIHATARAPDVRCAFRDRDGAPWVVLIENKVDAAEGSGQVRAYLAWARAEHPSARRMLVYITPEGRPPDSRLDGELVVSLSWSDIADLGLDAVDRAPADSHRDARRFARSVLESLRHRFGGDATVRACVQALHERHPKASALVASPAVERSRIAPLPDAHPTAVWHMQTVRPRPRAWSRRWSDAVTAAFNRGEHGLTLSTSGPHARFPDGASWAIDDVSPCLSLTVFATAGSAFRRTSPQLWLGLYAPARSALEAFTEREQLAAVSSLPPATRDLLLAATPVVDTGATWRALCVGAPVPLPRGYSSDDDAARVADAIAALLAPHADALRALSGDASMRLYSCDLDADHVFPTDARDREALRASARADAQRVLILGRHRDAHMHDLRREQELGVALGAAFGGASTLCYDDRPDALDRIDLVALGTRALRAPDDPSFERLRAQLTEALDRNATLLLLGEDGPTRLHPGALIINNFDLLSPVVRAHPAEVRAVGEGVFRVTPDMPSLGALLASDQRVVSAVLPLSVSDEAEVLATYTPARGEMAGVACAYLARWRVGGARVIYWGGGAMGAWGLALRERPERFARWWQAVTAVA